MTKTFLLVGSIAALLAVLLGAFGAHGLRHKIAPDLLTVYQTGVQYHFYHALGLLLLAVMSFHLPDSALLRWAGILMLMGIVLFSGSLYLLAISGVRWLGIITPFGGAAFIVAWLLLAFVAWKT